MSLRVHRLSMGLSQAYLVENERGLVLVDAGFPGWEGMVLRRMRKLGRDDLRLIFITHAHLDHYGSAAALRRLTGAPIAVHRADGAAMARGETRLGSVRGWGRLMEASMPLIRVALPVEPTAPDLELDDGDTLAAYGLDGVVHHAPGHTLGSSILLVEGRVAFAGDLLSTYGWPRVQGYFAEDWALLSESVDRLKGLGAEWIYAGHGRRPLRGEWLLACQVPGSGAEVA